MPIFFQQDVDRDTKLAVWKITEGEDFFLGQVPLQREITHPHKRLQHLSGRLLLKHLYPSFPLSLIRIADTRKPFLEDEAYHFSISHCNDFAAAIASPVNRVGVDIELVSGKVQRIAHKFVSVEELAIVNRQSSIVNEGRLTAHRAPAAEENLDVLTMLWSCKEALFKWYGKGQVDFREHMQLKSIIDAGNGRFHSIFCFRKEEELFLDLQSVFFNGLCLSYVVT
jgi:4'-phosphopantetheinyl transferase EntD